MKEYGQLLFAALNRQADLHRDLPQRAPPYLTSPNLAVCCASLTCCVLGPAWTYLSTSGPDPPLTLPRPCIYLTYPTLPLTLPLTLPRTVSLHVDRITLDPTPRLFCPDIPYPALDPAMLGPICLQVDRIRKSEADEPMGLYTYDSDLNIDFAELTRRRQMMEQQVGERESE